MSDLSLREARADGADERFLWLMLVEAASWRPEDPGLDVRELICDPRFSRYVRDWGRGGDAGVIAEAAGAPAGAVWWRHFTKDDHGYGFIEQAVPEVSIGVVVSMRGRGAGTALMRALIERARREGLAALSLSVEVDNPALRLYRRLGFTPVELLEGAWTMRLETLLGGSGETP